MVRIHAGEPDVLRRTLSARYLTGEYPSSSHSRPIWPLLAAIVPSMVNNWSIFGPPNATLLTVSAPAGYCRINRLLRLSTAIRQSVRPS